MGFLESVGNFLFVQDLPESFIDNNANVGLCHNRSTATGIYFKTYQANFIYCIILVPMDIFLWNK